MNDYGFGNFIYTLRTEKGLSQSQLGEMLGVTNKAVSRWENGSAKPRLEIMNGLCTVFGVKLEELAAGHRIEKDNELIRLRTSLAKTQKRYASAAALSLAVFTATPLLLVLFVVVMNYYSLPDSVAGPLGAVTLIVLFIVSGTCMTVFSTVNARYPVKYGMLMSDEEQESLSVRMGRVAWICIAVYLTEALLTLCFPKLLAATPYNVLIEA